MGLFTTLPGQGSDQADTGKNREETEVRHHIKEAGFIEQNHGDALEQVNHQCMASEKMKKSAAWCPAKGQHEEKTAGGNQIQFMQQE